MPRRLDRSESWILLGLLVRQPKTILGRSETACFTTLRIESLDPLTKNLFDVSGPCPPCYLFVIDIQDVYQYQAPSGLAVDGTTSQNDQETRAFPKVLVATIVGIRTSERFETVEDRLVSHLTHYL